MADSELPPVLTPQQAAEYLGISPEELYVLLKAGRIPAFKIAAKWFFDRDPIDRWAKRWNLETWPPARAVQQRSYPFIRYVSTPRVSSVRGERQSA